MKDSTCAVEGCKLLRLPKIRTALRARQQERFEALQMEGDEALALIALRARANLADAYDETGKLLPFHQWPETLQLAVRWRINGDGKLEVQHSDGLKAAELMAIATGKLKTNVLQVQFDHAAGPDHPRHLCAGAPRHAAPSGRHTRQSAARREQAVSKP